MQKSEPKRLEHLQFVNVLTHLPHTIPKIWYFAPALGSIRVLLTVGTLFDASEYSIEKDVDAQVKFGLFTGLCT